MRTVSLRQIDMAHATIPIGYEGENEFTQVRIDCKKTFQQYPDAVASLAVTDPSGRQYSVAVVKDGTVVVWNVIATDVASRGTGEIQINFLIDGTIVAKSAIAKTMIKRSIDPGGGGGGTSNYNDLSNKPQINGYTLSGNVTLQNIGALSADALAEAIATALAQAKASGEFDGADGQDGADGVGIASIAKTGTSGLVDTYTITLTSGSTYTFTVTNGQDGVDGQDGEDGQDGQNGFSPTVTVTTITGGHRVTITDAQGDHTFDVMDGQGGGGGGGAVIDDTAGHGDTSVVWSAGKTFDEVDSLKEAIGNVTEDYGVQIGWTPVTIASPLPVKEHYRCADSRGSKIGKTYDQATEGYTSSSVTSCVMSAFTCESGKKYRLTVTNGQTPAKTAERGTIVITKEYNSLKNVVLEAFRTTNTSNATDVFEFTPTEPGYVYFNLDANFQSIAVDVESVVGSSKTAVDDVVRNHVLNREITPELEFESGTFDTTLADASGSGYRSQIITGVKDCAICIKVDPDYTAMFGNGTDALVTVHGSYVYHSTKDAVRLWASDTVANSGLEIRIYKEKGHRGEFDVIVAASDSSDVDKQIADIVCDGTNDEIDLQFAVNWNFYRHIGNSSRDSVNVLLLPGNYYIDNFETKETLHGDDTVAQYAVMVGNDSFSGNAGYYYSASISGVSKTGHITNGAVTKINVTNGAVATLSDSVENVLIGVCRAGSRTGGGIHMNALCIEVKNLTIFTNGANNQIVALDGYTAGISIFENNDVWSVSSTSSWTPTSISEIPSGSIGIRAGDGSCYGVRQSIKGNRISGYHEGLAIVGEHFIIQDNLELRCTYGFTVNQYDHNGANQHPNVFIGNSVEQCYKMGRLGSYTSKQTLVYIGGSVENMIGNTGGEEVAMLPIEVSNDTKYRGRIESDSLVSPYDESMFESGKGTGFEQVIYPYTQA